MESKITRSIWLARVISRVTNPCILSVVVLFSIAFTESSNVRILVSWVMVLLLFLVVLPLTYTYIRISRNRSGTRLMVDPIVFLRQHPKDILILGILSGLPCVVILVFLEAPLLLLETLIALLVSSLIIAALNVFYRVSYHLAASTILVIMAPMAWGSIFLTTLAAIPLISWAKYRLHQHTPIQIAIGIVISLAVSGTTLYVLS